MKYKLDRLPGEAIESYAARLEADYPRRQAMESTQSVLGLPEHEYRRREALLLMEAPIHPRDAHKWATEGGHSASPAAMGAATPGDTSPAAKAPPTPKANGKLPSVKDMTDIEYAAFKAAVIKG